MPGHLGGENLPALGLCALSDGAATNILPWPPCSCPARTEHFSRSPGCKQVVPGVSPQRRGRGRTGALTKCSVSAFWVCRRRLFWAAMRFFSLLWTFLMSSEES